jgi:carbon monoxide dehydrogenase subunit G
MKKIRISREVAIDAPKQKVWEVLADFGAIDKSSPAVAKSHLTTEQKPGAGAEHLCEFAFVGASLKERIIEWNEGKSMKIDIYERKNVPLMKDMKAEFSVREEGGKTLLRGTMEYEMTRGMGNLINGIMMKKLNIKNWNKVLAGFKKYCESGKMIDTKTVLDVADSNEAK